VKYNVGSEILKIVLNIYQTRSIIRDTQHTGQLRGFRQSKRAEYVNVRQV